MKIPLEDPNLKLDTVNDLTHVFHTYLPHGQIWSYLICVHTSLKDRILSEWKTKSWNTSLQSTKKKVLTCQAIRNSPIWNSSFITFLPNKLSYNFISIMSRLWDCNTHMSSSLNVSSPFSFSDTLVLAPNYTSPPVLLEPSPFFPFSHV